MFDVVVVTGEQRGKMWWCDMAWAPHFRKGRQVEFLEWYEDWLDHSLGQASVLKSRDVE